MQRILIVATISSALALVACSEDGTVTATSLAPAPTFPTPTSEAPGRETIFMKDTLFTPSEVSAVAGGDIRLDNDDDAVHNFSVEDSDINVDVGAGEDASVTVDLEPGTYTMFCEFHRSQGMEGTLTVT